jgi:DNA polymerase-3 subunit gamma/tau
MRDALSVLDQCLSFGDGTLTVRSVRSILALVDDELYGEVLALVAERKPEGVFSLIQRLQESGADLAEFMNGAAEMLRALLMLQVGAEPEGLTEAMRQQLDRFKQALAPGDVLRMLKLLADQELAIRRSANPRLMVETLLLRWTLMDQMVDLEQVLGRLGGSSPSSAQAPTPTARPATPASSRASDPSRPSREPAPAKVSPPEAPEAVAPSPEGSVIEAIPFTVESLLSNWGAIVADARKASPFLGEALGAARPIAASPPQLTVELLDPNPVIIERLSRQRELVQGILSRYVAGAVMLTFGSASSSPEESASPRPRRMSDSGARAERLQTLRKKDPALDAAADELDLEIVD